MTISQSSLSLQYVLVPVTARVAGDRVDITTDVVKMAFPVVGVEPSSDDWKTADWETISGTYYARCLVGPSGTVTLTDGSYDIWIKVTDSPEVPAIKVDMLTIM